MKIQSRKCGKPKSALTAERRRKAKLMYAAGLTYTAIGAALGISRQRAFQIVREDA